MAKEFNVYLKSRIFEGDIAVISMPFRDGFDVASGIVIGSDVYNCLYLIPFNVESAAVLTSQIDDMVKTCIETIDASTDLSANLRDTLEHNFIEAHSAIPFGSQLRTLSFQNTSDGGSSSIEIRANVADLKYGYPFSRVYMDTDIGCNLEWFMFTLYVSGEHAMNIVEGATCSSTKFIAPSTSAGLMFEASPTYKRFILLHELSDNTIGSIGAMTLEDLSFIID